MPPYSSSRLSQELACGAELRVTELLGEDAETRELAQMGLESGRKVRLLWSSRQHLLLSVAGRTLGISRRLGSKVVVTADSAAA